jgi:hypothetical protein
MWYPPLKKNKPSGKAWRASCRAAMKSLLPKGTFFYKTCETQWVRLFPVLGRSRGKPHSSSSTKTHGPIGRMPASTFCFKAAVVLYASPIAGPPTNLSLSFLFDRCCFESRHSFFGRSQPTLGQRPLSKQPSSLLPFVARAVPTRAKTAPRIPLRGAPCRPRSNRPSPPSKPMPNI